MKEHKNSQQTRHKRKTLAWVLVSVAAVLLIARGLLPTVIEWTLNERILNDLGEYTGRVGDVDVALIRGSYRVQSLVVRKKSGDQYRSFLKIPQSDIGIDWRALTQGELSVEVDLQGPQINFEDAANQKDSQSGKGGSWQVLVDKAIPFAINSLRITDGTLNFHNRDSSPKVDLSADNIDFEVSNLTNIRDKNGERIASARLTARLFKSAEASAQARFDPFDYNDFLVALKIDGMRLRNLNDFGKAYASIDFANGTGRIYSEVKAQNARLSGYVKPFFEDVEILDWEQDVERQSDGVFQFLWEGAVDLVETLLNNQQTDQLATEVQIEGSINKSEVQTWSAVWGVVKNAFVSALEEQFNQTTPLAPLKDDREPQS